ncbi:stage II sporulation protein M [Ruminiclostridium hungatei]|uniref:Stage II sporulation protein M n=1 Tax=Ruminiclostridium hungatei TaxID=48256 RepID=A0A1V4SK84_RUMHU|nr:stage II sporulation protein M [Ruminiclostridium hungatei]OPX43641.1 stage II sporulation protein M [Ruminiclostridium hungatei]
MFKKTGNVVKEHIKNNKFLYLSLFLFYIIGICLGAASVNDLDFQQKGEMVTFFNGFVKLLDTNDFDKLDLLKITLLDNTKLILLFWVLGFTVVGFPVYYAVLGMRGFSTGFGSGIIMGMLGTKGILISTICFVPKEIILVPCLVALGVNGIKLSGAVFKTWLKRSGSGYDGIKQKIGPYNFVAAFFSFFILLTTLIETFISSGALKLLNF